MQNGLHIDSRLSKECDRWLERLGVDERLTPHALTATEVLKAHFLLADYFNEIGQGIGGLGPKSLHLLQSAVSRQYVSFGGKVKWTDLFSVAATLFFGIIKNHPFHDANKRTALLAALYQLQCHNRVPDSAQKEFEDLAVRVAEDALSKYPSFRELRDLPDKPIRFIAKFFKTHTRQLDKRQFRVTYRQLESILGRFGYKLQQSHSNRLDVLKETEERHGFLHLKRRRVFQRISTIGFRDWGTEVSQSDLRELRKELKLTAEAGYDTTVLTQGVNPMEVLIAEYSGPLRRLARK